MDSSSQVFGTNQRFKNAIAVINSVPGERFPLVLIRILQKIHLKNEKPFTEVEEQQLQNLFHLSPSDLTSVLDSCTFIFEQAAYFGLTPQVLTLQLEKVGVSTAKLGAFEQAWQDQCMQVIANLKHKTVVPSVLDHINWRLHLQVAQSSLSRLKEPSAIFDFCLSPSSPSSSSKTGSTSSQDHVTVEFTHAELRDFFEKLEVIQEQLDNLTT